MNSITNSNTSFKGAFLINYKNAIPGLKEGFEKTLGVNKKIIFREFNENPDDVLYVLKNSKDYDSAQFIKRNEMGFQYMPDLDTRLQFDPYYPKNVISYIKEQKPRVITKIKELMDFVEENRFACRSKKDFAKDNYYKILRRLNVNINGVKEHDSNDVVFFVDKNNGGKVAISPESKYGMRFVYVKPANKYDEEKRYIIDKNCNIMAQYTTAQGILKFRKQFQRAIDFHTKKI